ncbi:metallophosphoesterase family protein [Paenibacillus sp. FSL R10-2736]|uniref:metallophosphoesterase family protein n=1 Tax=Paenibacillus sp. FSL R10-2736 TaxID=2954692 RepID=UPI0030FC5E08
MRIIHLSDFHIASNSIKDTFNFIVEALVKDLAQYNNDKKIDLIIFSGDLIDKGGQRFESIEHAFSEFETYVASPLLEALNLSKEHFIFVPGNHDIDRNADSHNTEIGLRSTLCNETAVSQFIEDNKKNPDEIKRIIPFKNFERKYHLHTPNSEITNFHSTYHYKYNNKEVGISAFNTAWRCYDSDHDNNNILLGIKQAKEAKKQIEKTDFKIAVIHHQLDLLKDFDMEIVQPFMQREYDLVLCGHVHKGSSHKETSTYGDLLVSIAPSNTFNGVFAHDQRFFNGYSIIDFSFENNNFLVHHRMYSQNHDRYIANIELGPDDNGKVTYNKETGNKSSNIQKKRMK